MSVTSQQGRKVVQNHKKSNIKQDKKFGVMRTLKENSCSVIW